MWHRTSFTKRRALFLLVSVWVIGLGFNAGYMIPTAIVGKDGKTCHIYENWPSDNFRKVFGVCMTTVQFFIPLTILIYAYVRIVYVLKAVRNIHEKNEGSRQSRYHHAQKNTIKTLAIVAMSFVLCWSWNQIYYTMMNLGFPTDFASPFYHFTVICVFLNCCINPFIYVVQYERFQIAMKEMFCKIKGEEFSSQLSNTNRNTAVVSQSQTDVHQVFRDI